MAEQKKDDGKEKKSSKKLIIIIVAVVILLAGGGAGYFFFMKGNEASETKDEKSDYQEKTDEKSEEGDDAHSAAEKLYYDLGKPLVVDFSKSASVRFVSISLSFFCDGAETVEALTKNEPMIRNNLLMLINAQGAEALKTKEGKEQLRAAILQEVKGALEKMAAKNDVLDVFFTSFVMQ